jgi:hypothetical protein
VMAVWEDVVTVGLVGTDRRPVPDQLPPSWGTERNPGMDPAHVVLSLAARHRAVTRAGGPLASCPPAPLGPPDRQPVASRAAHEILDRLLSPPQLELLNLWLIAAVQHGQLVSSSYWTPLALVAARTPAVDRTAMARAIGERGVWFVAQNPQWTRLSSSLRSHLHDDLLSDPNTPEVVVSEDAVRADPQLILGAATPWSKHLSETVLKIIGSGRLREHRSRYAATIGLHLPVEHYELLRSAVQQRPVPDDALTPLALRSIREAYRILERTVWVRIEIQSAFAGVAVAVQRLEIPPW